MAKSQADRAAAAAASGLNTVALQVVASNPTLQGRIESILTRMLDEVEHTMAHGTARDRQAMMRAIVPYLFRGYTDARASASSEEERAAHMRIMQALAEG